VIGLAARARSLSGEDTAASLDRVARGRSAPRNTRPGGPAERPLRGHPDEPSDRARPDRDATLAIARLAVNAVGPHVGSAVVSPPVTRAPPASAEGTISADE